MSLLECLAQEFSRCVLAGSFHTLSKHLSPMTGMTDMFRKLLSWGKKFSCIEHAINVLFSEFDSWSVVLSDGEHRIHNV